MYQKIFLKKWVKKIWVKKNLGKKNWVKKKLGNKN